MRQRIRILKSHSLPGFIIATEPFAIQLNSEAQCKRLLRPGEEKKFSRYADNSIMFLIFWAPCHHFQYGPFWEIPGAKLNPPQHLSTSDGREAQFHNPVIHFSTKNIFFYYISIFSLKNYIMKPLTPLQTLKSKSPLHMSSYSLVK